VEGDSPLPNRFLYLNLRCHFCEPLLAERFPEPFEIVLSA